MPADSKAHKETMEDHAGKTAKAKNEDEHEDAMESDQESMSNKPMGAMSKNEKASGLEKQADKKMAQLDKKGDKQGDKKVDKKVDKKSDKKGDKGKPMPENSKKWWKFWED
jgi:hypothetical protein